MKNYNEKAIKTAAQALEAALKIVENNLAANCDESILYDVSKLMQAAVSMGKQEAIQKIIIKANHLASAEQPYISNLKED